MYSVPAVAVNYPHRHAVWARNMHKSLVHMMKAKLKPLLVPLLWQQGSVCLAAHAWPVQACHNWSASHGWLVQALLEY